MNSTSPCNACGANVPTVGEPDEDTWTRMFHALDSGSKGIAAAEVQAALGMTSGEANAWLAHRLACPYLLPFAADVADALALVDQAFGNVARPEHFTDASHCSECADHDATLRSRSVRTLRRRDLGNIGWDPIASCNVEGIKYFMPALIRYALLPSRLGEDHFAAMLVPILGTSSRAVDIVDACSTPQRQAVSTSLALLRVSFDLRDDVRVAIEHWTCATSAR